MVGAMQSTIVLTDPTALTPAQWSGRLAAYLARGRGNDDPAVAACRAALSYWRCRRVIDAEADALDPAHADALAARLRTAVPA
ncbi:hypothetical protein JF723_22950 [Mycobacterium intracellulare]|nr:hypothetical protein [Mycobacterium intracellulare]MCA2369468.1 hypothetical protein [Mycobacterium intracellulare]